MPEPSVTDALRNLRFNGRSPRLEHWDEESRAMLVLAEFSATNWAKINVDPFPTAAIAAAEIAELISRIGERADLLPEILGQSTTLVPSFAAALGITRQSHPATHLLLTTCEKISAFVAPRFKNAPTPRPRPSQIAPGLHPPVPVPQTPSYPQQHGLSAYLIARCLGSLLPAAAAKPLTELAFNFADNRVVAGLSYPSDVAAAEKLAGSVYPLLSTCASFKNDFERAKEEWVGATAIELPDARPIDVDVNAMFQRFQAAGERMLLVIEPVPDRVLTGEDLGIGLRFISDLTRYAIATVNAIDLMAATPTLTEREAVNQAIAALKDDPLAELEILGMGTGSLAWFETFMRKNMTAPVFGIMLALAQLASQGIGAMERHDQHRQNLQFLERVITDPHVTESQKRSAWDLIGEDFRSTQSTQDLKSKNLVPKVLPADQESKRSLEHAHQGGQQRARDARRGHR